MYKRRLTNVILGVALLACWPQVGMTAPAQAFRRLDSVVQVADAIALGVVGAARPTAGGIAVTLQVVEVLKGTLPGSIEAWYAAERVPNPVLEAAGETAVVFLAPPRASGERQLLPLTDGAPPAHYVVLLPKTDPAVILPRLTPEDTALTKVIKTLARTAGSMSPLGGWTYILSLAWARDIDPTAAVALRDVFQALRDTADAQLAERGLHGLMALGQIEGLRAVRDALLQPPDDWIERRWPDLLESYYRSESLEGTAILEGMISPANPAELRRAAGRVLGRIHSFAMLPLLARMLDDTDIDLRSSAVRGFSAFAAGFRTTGPQRKEGEWPFLTVEAMTWAVHDDALFRQREGDYLGFWRDWWPRNQALVTEMAQREGPPR